ncbi:MAG: LysR family transcriptional regulator [Peptococcaceae bacterium]|nr:LysR family transcriptional regulator [Peptococcaceae bacterium]
MNTDQMAYLIDIAKTGSINTTAKRLFSSQQAISESIKRLEAELECVLLIRSKKGVALTEDGKYVLQQVSNMYEQYEELQKYFKRDQHSLNGSLYLGTAIFATTFFLPDLIFDIYRNYPDLTLHTKELQIREIIDQLLQGNLDFGIAGFSDEGNYVNHLLNTTIETYNDSLIFQPLFEDEICCIMSKNNPYAALKKITDEQMSQLKLTRYNYTLVDESFPYLHISNNTTIHQKFMKEENTAAILPRQLFKQLYSQKEFVAIPFDYAPTTTTCLIYRKEKDKSENLLFQTFINTAIDLARKI